MLSTDDYQKTKNRNDRNRLPKHSTEPAREVATNPFDSIGIVGRTLTDLATALLASTTLR